jgi:hypothetical protein
LISALAFHEIGTQLPPVVWLAIEQQSRLLATSGLPARIVKFKGAAFTEGVQEYQEEFEAMVKLGLANSRMKNFYDIWALSQEFDFDGEVLSGAIQATFKRRKTILAPEMPFALTPEFCDDPPKLTQGKAFVSRSRLKLPVGDFEQVVAEIRRFLGIPVAAASQGKRLRALWPKGGPWLDL